ncbi:type 1 glutamine amidotransferase [Limosilactobacillus caccae]|uniref:type 1 glutamine amidotransferase n=1 Tax=Limosilactobacillus caccae TaxID=1926284 RepID=UPI000970F951|nr:type 1 glutamine amidotransferase [Limosilactobacillus caccae]
MRINILQHSPNEGPGFIMDWAYNHDHNVYTYHPSLLEKLPSAEETDMLVILGGSMSPNDDEPWIKEERELIKQLLDAHRPIFGACFGAQQIAKTLGYKVGKAPHKEVGWAPVYRQNDIIPGVPEKLVALHWHEEMFEVPAEAQLLFSSDLLKNQGFILNDNVVGLQFHFEPAEDDLQKMVVNDGQYALDGNDLNQRPGDILKHGVPQENQQIMFKILDFITK